MTHWFAQSVSAGKDSPWFRVTARDAARHSIVRHPVCLGRPAGARVRLACPREAAPYVPKPGLKARPLCRWCHGECPGRRRTFCSARCVKEYQEANPHWGSVRRKVEQRDKGVCCECGHDTAAARDWWWRIERHLTRDHEYPAVRQIKDRLDELAKAAGWPKLTRDWWEADHIVSRRDGGPDHPDNLRTLCVFCHKARTKKQRRKWATPTSDNN